MKKGLVLHGSHEWGGKGLGSCKMKHEKGLGASWFPEWGGKGLGRPKMKHEKGVGCFMVQKRGVGRACGNGFGRPKMKREKWLRASWFPSLGWERLGKARK